MDHVLSQLLLGANQPEWRCEALLEQASLSSDPGYYSACSVPETGCSSSCSFSKPDNNDVCQNLDAGYYSACGSASPASSVDSGCFSPPSFLWGLPDCSPPPVNIPTAREKVPAHTSPAQTGRKSRSRNPGKKRQSASEREKLRMRDLAKALHHLRTFLPPSVAPAGQTLTKIETLRLAIGYIGHLSDQLKHDQPRGGAADFPPLPVPQEDFQGSFQPSNPANPVMTGPLPSFQPGFTFPSDHLSPLSPFQNPIGDFSLTDIPSECFWIPELSHTL